jgi:hypothetical protein
LVESAQNVLRTNRAIRRWESDHRQGLRARCERPSRRAAERSNEFTPSKAHRTSRARKR